MSEGGEGEVALLDDELEVVLPGLVVEDKLLLSSNAEPV